MNTFGVNTTISKFADIETSSRGSELIIGNGVCIDAFVKIKFTGGTGDITIGDNTYVNSGCVLYSGNGIKIGKNVLLAANCTFAPVNHAYEQKDKLILEQRFKPSKGGIFIGDDVWIGAGAVILDGTVIETGCVVAAGSIVKERLTEYGVYAGHPLKLIKKRC